MEYVLHYCEKTATLCYTDRVTVRFFVLDGDPVNLSNPSIDTIGDLGLYLWECSYCGTMWWCSPANPACPGCGADLRKI